MSQTQRILNALRDGYTLSPLMALHRFGTLRLSERIREAEKLMTRHEWVVRRWKTIRRKRVMSYALVDSTP